MKNKNIILLVIASFLISLLYLIGWYSSNSVDDMTSFRLITLLFLGLTLILLGLSNINDSINNIKLTVQKENNNDDHYRYSKLALSDYFIKTKEIFISQKSAGIRYGQVLYNHLTAVRPDLAQQILAGPLDPFYKNEYEELQSFYTWINEEWTKIPRK